MYVPVIRALYALHVLHVCIYAGASSKMPSSILAGAPLAESSTTSSLAKHSSMSRFRRVSGLIGGAVKSVARGLGISGERVAALDRNMKVDTPRLIEMALEEKVRDRGAA